MSDLLELDRVSRRFGGLQAVDEVTLKVGRGEVLGLIGPNGAGKTTLVNVITGVHPASSGRIRFEGRDITGLQPYQAARAGLARTFQVVQPFPELTALQNVQAAALFSGGNSSMSAARERAMEQLEFVGLADQANKSATSLTLAMRKRLELAKALAMSPRLLFLDEVNAGLNTAEIERAMGLLRQIADSGITIVLIEHLMKVVTTVCSRIVVLHHGALIADGPVADVVADSRVVEAYLGKRYAQTIAQEAT
ncbi:MAG: ABC transporter ATP-binding protein [Burkholderiaceae bacterium]